MPFTPWQSARFTLLETARRRPALFFPLARHWQRRGRLQPVHLLDARTDLVVEGFFRSGNTYAAHAIALASGDRLRLAYHSHAAATIKRAARRGVPILVLIRHPADAVTSNALKHDYVPMRQSLRAYINFYRAVLPWRAHFVAATFEQATGDINAVIERLNARFALELSPLPDDPATQQTLTDRLHAPQARHLADRPGKADLPSEAKERAKQTERRRLDQPALRPWRDAAEAIHHRFLHETGLIKDHA